MRSVELDKAIRKEEGLLADSMHIKPTHANQLMRASVRILPNMKPTIAATATKTAVQVP